MTLALLFSPQGSQAPGMGRELASLSDGARAAFEEADATLGWSVSAICWDGPTERLNDTRQTQPCLLTTSVAAYRALAERTPVEPSFLAGHSVGEYAALVVAGVLDLAAALRLVQRRADLMAAADGEGGMAAVIGLDREAVQAAVDAVARPTELVVANDNAPGQVVISGRRDALAAAEGAMRVAGARRILPLSVSGAFHSPLMGPVAKELAAAFDNEEWHDARVAIVSNVTAEPVTDAGRIRALLAEQVCSPVEWVAAVRRMVSDGVDTMVECGAGTALVGMVRRIAPDVATGSVLDRATLEASTALLAAEAVSA